MLQSEMAISQYWNQILSEQTPSTSGMVIEKIASPASIRASSRLQLIKKELKLSTGIFGGDTIFKARW